MDSFDLLRRCILSDLFDEIMVINRSLLFWTSHRWKHLPANTPIPTFYRHPHPTMPTSLLPLFCKNPAGSGNWDVAVSLMGSSVFPTLHALYCVLWWISHEICHTLVQMSACKIFSINFSSLFKYRSPWSNKYHPPLEDGPVPSDDLRKLEIEANDIFSVYRDQSVPPLCFEKSALSILANWFHMEYQFTVHPPSVSLFVWCSLR